MNHLPATQTPVQRDDAAADASGPEAGFYADDDRPRSAARPASRLHPLVMAAAISTIALSATGVAWFAGLLPSSPGAQAPVAAAVPTTDAPSAPAAPAVAAAPQAEVAAPPAPSAPVAATPAPATTPVAPKVVASTPKHKAPAHHAAVFDDEELRSHGTPRRYSDSTGTWREPAGVRHVQYYSSSDGRAPIYYEDRNQGYQSAPPPPPPNYQQGYQQQGYPQQNYQPAYNSAPPVCRDCGTVENVHVVQQRGEASGAGAVAGGVIGGVLGHQLGNGRGNTAMTVLGAVGGAVAGNQIEKSSRSGSRYEIVVRMDDGSSRVLTQEQPPSLRSGDRVRVNGNGIMPY